MGSNYYQTIDYLLNTHLAPKLTSTARSQTQSAQPSIKLNLNRIINNQPNSTSNSSTSTLYILMRAVTDSFIHIPQMVQPNQLTPDIQERDIQLIRRSLS
ncbi:hypothetical protein KEM48_001703 [Puccinia striiformis f. sp. tritici PST-130]|nr:hypothetical protein KEM48_001703 [Puccinia striiformis f. sp. tritici PST-130]